MTMTDPIADMLTRLRNATRAHHDAVSMPYSKLKNAIANILVEEGYIASTSVEDARVGKTLTINLKYGSHREAAIQGLKRVSKPGLRVYAGADELPRVLRGLGTAIVSTSKGVMPDKKAREAHVGGEVLAFVW